MSETYDKLIEDVMSKKIFDRVQVLAKDWLGASIVAGIIEAGEDKPNILISAGAHGDEAAGVHAAVKIAESLPVSANLYVVLCRDPTGNNPLSLTLSKMFEIKAEISGPEDIHALVSEYGEHLETKSLRIGVFRNVCVVYPRGAAELETLEISEELEKELKLSEELREVLDRKRILVPLCKERPGTPPYSKVRTFYAIGDKLVCYDYFGEENDLPEVLAMKKFLNKIKPILTLDLHEGPSGKFCVIVPGAADEAYSDVVFTTIQQVEKHAAECLSAEEIKKVMIDHGLSVSKTLGKGIGVIERRENLVTLAREYGVSLMLWTGFYEDFEKRVETLIVAAHSAAYIFAALHGL
ncbi:MAG: hypothetical protein DRJ52_05100 [Thermoprotei archaeon]|nr:MAG: hypothetical protein DRJ52_05100 [Thermoprotei archaeon]